MLHIRKGRRGRRRSRARTAGKRGKVLLVDPKKGRVKVEKVNLIKKHVQPSQKHPQGGIVEKEGTRSTSPTCRLWDPKARRRDQDRGVRVDSRTARRSASPRRAARRSR